MHLLHTCIFVYFCIVHPVNSFMSIYVNFVLNGSMLNCILLNLYLLSVMTIRLGLTLSLNETQFLELIPILGSNNSDLKLSADMHTF